MNWTDSTDLITVSSRTVGVPIPMQCRNRDRNRFHIRTRMVKEIGNTLRVRYGCGSVRLQVTVRIRCALRDSTVEHGNQVNILTVGAVF